MSYSQRALKNLDALKIYIIILKLKKTIKNCRNMGFCRVFGDKEIYIASFEAHNIFIEMDKIRIMGFHQLPYHSV